MPDVVISHLNALAAKDKKTLGVDPAFMYHGLVIPDEIPHQDVEDTLFLRYRPIHSSPLQITPSIPQKNMIHSIMGVRVLL